MALPESKLDICNLAFRRIGAKVITSAVLTADETPEAKHANSNYEQTRDALLRSHYWRFASDRATLVRGADPPFGYDHSYKLPSDFLAQRTIYDDNEPDMVFRNQHAFEGSLILTDEDICQIRYIKRVTEVKDFDPLFVEVLVLSLALKLVMPLSQDRVLYREIKDELYKEVMPKVRTVDKQETNTKGRAGKLSWNESRY